MTKEQAISKVRKLFELSKSSNENEAALAAAKAREFLSEHNLSMADLPTDDMERCLDVLETTAEAGRALRNWVKGLFAHVAAGFECEGLVKRIRGASPVLTFVGAGADAEGALLTFQFLHNELNRIADRALPGLKLENPGWRSNALRYAYLEGAVKRIGERFRERTREIKAVESAGCGELIVAKQQMVDRYIKKTFPNLGEERGRRRIVSHGAFERGYRDGSGVNLDAGTVKRNNKLIARRR
jgi:hypothetical protein